MTTLLLLLQRRNQVNFGYWDICRLQSHICLRDGLVLSSGVGIFASVRLKMTCRGE